MNFKANKGSVRLVRNVQMQGAPEKREESWYNHADDCFEEQRSRHTVINRLSELIS